MSFEPPQYSPPPAAGQYPTYPPAPQYGAPQHGHSQYGAPQAAPPAGPAPMKTGSPVGWVIAAVAAMLVGVVGGVIAISSAAAFSAYSLSQLQGVMQGETGYGDYGSDDSGAGTDPLAGDDPFGASAYPVDLPWDVAIEGDASVAALSTFPGSGDWVASSAANGGWENASTGCWVGTTNGYLPDDADLSGGDRAASKAFIVSMLGLAVDDADAEDTTFTTGDGFSESGTADALLYRTTSDAGVGFFVARVFSTIGEGAMVMGYCPDEASAQQTLDVDVPALYTISIVPKIG